ncbi:MAG: hypothetical protein UHK54_01080 [Acutalibacteraceae bacterium]|nr:hypothetical protein [Clostridia bacterium]MEE1283430.1 hypothetical protein [Acutalibacteraceae bacterium]
MKKFKEYSFIYLLGAVIYSLIEVAFRGFTHWTMALTGGLAYLLIYIANIKMKTRSLALRCLSGCIIITALEFIVGCIVNRRFNMGVWDYSQQPGHILGQICPLFSAIWFLISFPAMLLSFFIKGRLFSSDRENS